MVQYGVSFFTICHSIIENILNRVSLEIYIDITTIQKPIIHDTNSLTLSEIYKLAYSAQPITPVPYRLQKLIKAI